MPKLSLFLFLGTLAFSEGNEKCLHFALKMAHPCIVVCIGGGERRNHMKLNAKGKGGIFLSLVAASGGDGGTLEQMTTLVAEDFVIKSPLSSFFLPTPSASSVRPFLLQKSGKSLLASHSPLI